METKEMPCVICGESVQVAIDIGQDVDVLCMTHFFTEDVTEEWETGDGTIED